jgi:hypothetical protein
MIRREYPFADLVEARHVSKVVEEGKEPRRRDTTAVRFGLPISRSTHTRTHTHKHNRLTAQMQALQTHWSNLRFRPPRERCASLVARAVPRSHMHRVVAE